MNLQAHTFVARPCFVQFDYVTVSFFTKERDLIDLWENNQTVIWGFPV